MKEDKLWYVKIDDTWVDKFEAQVTYGNIVIQLTIKPNVFMRLFIKILGGKVQMLDEER